jgi:hypothetical protein
MNKIFYCISYYEGTLEILNYIDSNDYIIYDKSFKGLNINNTKIIKSPNVGYNIDSYLTFIIDNYDSLPGLIFFCKNNIFPRHVGKDFFEKIKNSKTFTSVHDTQIYKNINFPVSIICNDNSYLEINNSWYTRKYKSKYFSSYNDFYQFVFETTKPPLYLNFCPGANYIVPKENILIRSKSFYINLKSFISHSQLSCESHFIERSLITIWNSTVKESQNMKTIIMDLNSLNKKNKKSIFKYYISKSLNKILLIILNIIAKLYIK